VVTDQVSTPEYIDNPMVYLFIKLDILKRKPLEGIKIKLDNVMYVRQAGRSTA
jgi:hypothetical protein